MTITSLIDYPLIRFRQTFYRKLQGFPNNVATTFLLGDSHFPVNLLINDILWEILDSIAVKGIL